MDEAVCEYRDKVKHVTTYIVQFLCKRNLTNKHHSTIEMDLINEVPLTICQDNKVEVMF